MEKKLMVAVVDDRIHALVREIVECEFPDIDPDRIMVIRTSKISRHRAAQIGLVRTREKAVQLKYAQRDWDYIIEVNDSVWVAYEDEKDQKHHRRIIRHELMHVGYDKHNSPKLVDHDVVAYLYEIDQFGIDGRSLNQIYRLANPHAQAGGN